MINETGVSSSVWALCGISGLLWFIINEADVTYETKGTGFLWALMCECIWWLTLAHYDVCPAPDVCVCVWVGGGKILLSCCPWVQVVLVSSGSLPSVLLRITAPMEKFMFMNNFLQSYKHPLLVKLPQTPAKVRHISLQLCVIIKRTRDY